MLEGACGIGVIHGAVSGASCGMSEATRPGLSQDKEKLLPRLRSNMRLRHYSERTVAAYSGWVVRFVRFHGLRHPAELGEAEVVAFLRHLVVDRRLSASTQTQALAALLFCYRHLLGRTLRVAGMIPRARGPIRLPAVLSREEVGRVLERLTGSYRLIGLLLYGSGLRIMEAVRLRIKDVDSHRINHLPLPGFRY